MLNLSCVEYILDSQISLCICYQYTNNIIYIKLIYILIRLSGDEDNTNQDGNQSFCEKDSDKYELEMNKAHRINSIDSNEDIECKSLDDGIEEGYVFNILYSSLDLV